MKVIYYLENVQCATVVEKEVASSPNPSEFQPTVLLHKTIYRSMTAFITMLTCITILSGIGSDAISGSPETDKLSEPVVPEKPITPTETAPENSLNPKSPNFEAQKSAKQIERLQDALKEKDESIRIWAIRAIAKYPEHISGPLLLKQLKEENNLAVRCVIVYSLGELEYKEAIPDLINVLKSSLCDYTSLKPPEVYQEKLTDLRKRLMSVDQQNEKRAIMSNGRLTKEQKQRALEELMSRTTAASVEKQREIAEITSQMLESYKQKLNLGLLYIYTMQALSKFKCKEATKEVYRLLFDPSVPLAYAAIDTLKVINDPKAIELLSHGNLIDWDPSCHERLSFALTELNVPYSQSRPRKGTEWILKSIFMLSKAEFERPGQSNDLVMKALNIMRLLSDPACTPYKFSGEVNDNLMTEFIDLTNLLKANNPEAMLYDYDILIQFIKNEMQKRALYQTFQDVLKPPPQLAVPTPGSNK